jgi:hypothetical protein
MKILVQFPTLGRPDKFLNCLSKYVAMSSGNNSIKYNINCDIYDGTMNDQEIIDKIKDIFAQQKGNINSATYKINFDKNTDKISAINNHIQENEFDVVVCASDDMVPKVEDWDMHISQAMSTWFPDLDGCVHFNDGNTNGKLITFSILGRKLYDHFGYIYHPDYKSLYCDDEFTHEVRRLGKEKYIDNVIIAHEHYSIEGTINSGDFDYAAQKTLYYSGRDQSVFNERKRLGFPKVKITND